MKPSFQAPDLVLIIPLFIVGFASFDATAKSLENTFSDDEQGFSVEKPGAWKFEEDIKSAKEELVDGSETPAVVMDVRVAFSGNLKTKNKRMACIVDEVKGTQTEPLKILNIRIAQKSHRDKDFKVLEQPHLVKESAAEMAHSVYSLVSDEKKKAVRRAYSNWYFRGNKGPLRLECTVEEQFLNEAKVDFDRIIKTLSLK